MSIVVYPRTQDWVGSCPAIDKILVKLLIGIFNMVNLDFVTVIVTSLTKNFKKASVNLFSAENF